MIRIVVALLVAGALGRAVSGVSTSTYNGPEAASCSSPALSEALHGAFRVMSVQNFGCAQDFAYLWATVGTNEQDAIGVTEVLRFKVPTERWTVVSRLKYCHPTTLPTFVYKLGCFSN
jgi:hypothetical protein